MMTIPPIGEHTTGDTVAATDAMTIAGIGEMPTMTRTTGIPMNIIGRTAVTTASAAAEGSTDGGGGAVGHSATHLR